MRRLLIIPLIMLLAGGIVRAAQVEKAAAPADPSGAIRNAVAWLHTQQLPDGGFGRGQSSPAMTADIVYALALAGENPDGPDWTTATGHSALDALGALAPAYVGTDAGQAGKVGRAVALAGGNPRDFAGLDLVQIIQDAYDPATGRYHPSFLYRHTLAVEGLLRSGVTVPPAALDALRQAQLKEGGWFWSFGGTTGDVDTTGRVLDLLAGLAGVSDAAAYSRAADYLADLQLPEGGWNAGYMPGPANANSTALVVGGLAATGLDPHAPRFQRAGKSGLDTLLSFQEPSGAFVYVKEAGKEEVRLMATADALVALAARDQTHTADQRPYLPVFYID